MNKKFLKKAVRLAGGQSALARAIGVTQSYIYNWLHRDEVVPPAKYVLKIEKAVGVSRHDLRPDLYPPQNTT
jgi:DNA-binding transcriptional regulator YdaS (Cro superfamily)